MEGEAWDAVRGPAKVEVAEAAETNPVPDPVGIASVQNAATRNRISPVSAAWIASAPNAARR